MTGGGHPLAPGVFSAKRRWNGPRRRAAPTPRKRAAPWEPPFSCLVSLGSLSLRRRRTPLRSASRPGHRQPASSAALARGGLGTGILGGFDQHGAVVAAHLDDVVGIAGLGGAPTGGFRRGLDAVVARAALAAARPRAARLLLGLVALGGLGLRLRLVLALAVLRLAVVLALQAVVGAVVLPLRPRSSDFPSPLPSSPPPSRWSWRAARSRSRSAWR